MRLPSIFARFRRQSVAFFGDFSDPYCYIGFTCLTRAAERRDVTVALRGFPLNSETPQGGYLLEPGANSDLAAGMWPSVQAYAKRAGIAISRPSRWPDTRLALGLVEAAPRAIQQKVARRLFAAYFEECRDIGEPATLRSLCDDIGLASDVLHASSSDRIQAALDQNRQAAFRYRFPGLPGFVYHGKTYFGALTSEAWDVIFESGSPTEARTRTHEREMACTTK